MTPVQMLRAAHNKTGVQVLLLQIGLSVAAFLLFLVWLRIPDANSAEVALSALLAIVFSLSVAGGEAWTLLRVRGTTATRASVVRGALTVFIALALLFPLSALVNHLSVADSQRAGYINSQMSVGMRLILTYPRLLSILHQAWDSLFWAIAIVLAMAAVSVTVAHRPLNALGRMAGSFTAWIAVSLATIAASEVTLRLMNWTPGHGLRMESASLLLRITIAVLLDAYLLCFSLALFTVLAEVSDTRYIADVTDAGTPDFNQPRTAGKP